VTDKLERMFKEAVLSRHFTGKTEENYEKPIRIAGLRAEIFARNL
jgi:hypothetical protein